MIKSMTGYGKSMIDFPGRHVTIEIKSLNSKQLDLNTRIPSRYREKEFEIRSLVSEMLERGKVDLSIQQDYTGEEAIYTIEKQVALSYYRQIVELKEMLPGIPEPDYMNLLLKLPEVIKADKSEMDESEWENLKSAVRDAISEVDRFRSHEGEILGEDITRRIGNILTLLTSVGPYENERMTSLRSRLLQNVETAFGESNYDKNRFEQEMIYYLEKLDITEEKVRLQKHCDFFLKIMKEPASQGKKLGFITQEIGREINTLGSKAYDAEIQKIIVAMKDELEKIKEQLMNIL
jgi:uncharacterized protein (TIGR00255 family)